MEDGWKMEGSMDIWVGGWVINGWMGWKNLCMHAHIDRWVSQWKDTWISEQWVLIRSM